MNIDLQVPSLTVEDALQQQVTYVDVRTPKEFEHFHIPGALHLPLFSTEEHARIGTVYRQQGKEAAKQIGLNLFSKKLPHLYQQFKSIKYEHKGKLLVVYCWRGGMRSRSIVSVMSTLGIPVLQLQEGIRAYRRWIVQGLAEEAKKNKPYIVLDGYTGTGKTHILHHLAQEGYPVLDLEGLAHHRGSVFGHIGQRPRNQKQFECALWDRIQKIQDAPYYLIEAESARIGNVHLPDAVLRGKREGIRIQIEAPLEFRIRTICQTYLLDRHYEQFVKAFSTIEKRLPSKAAQEIRTALARRDAAKVVQMLLHHYYDPRYDYAAQKQKPPAYSLHVQSLTDGVNKVKKTIDQIVNKPGSSDKALISRVG